MFCCCYSKVLYRVLYSDLGDLLVKSYFKVYDKIIWKYSSIPKCIVGTEL